MFPPSSAPGNASHREDAAECARVQPAASRPLRVDAHVDLLDRLLAERFEAGSPEDIAAAPRGPVWPEGPGHLDLPRIRAGGFDCYFLPLYSPTERGSPVTPGLSAAGRTLAMLRLGGRIAEEHADELAFCRSVAEVRAAAAAGKVALVWTMENAAAFEASIDALEWYAEVAGVRALGLVWNGPNRVAWGTPLSSTGYGGRPLVPDPVEEGRGPDSGLTAFGREVVRACERLGIIVDLSHLMPAGVADALALATKPLVATHSNARALCDHPRNLSDEQLRAIAATGGVIGLNFYPRFLANDPWGASPAARVQDLVAHARHIADVAGPEHLGIGTDYDGITETPEGLPDVSAMPLLAEALREAGFSRTELDGILGENWLRVAGQVWGT